MPVICAVCQTENRDAAMFCHGCARKLPGFAATGPSLLDGMRPRPLAGAGGAAARRAGAPQNASRGFWIGLGAVMLAATVGFGGWFGYVTRKVPAPVPSSTPVVVAPPPAAAPPVQASAPPVQASASPSEPVPPGSTLGAGESNVAPSSASSATMPTPNPIAAEPVPVPAPQPPAQRRAAPAQATAPRTQALDPRQGCQGLNFFAAARCEAAHCDQAAYARHPRCDAVREDRKRDEARRNPTLGT